MKDHAHFGLKVSKCLVLLTLIAAALFVGAGPLHAQEVTAAITGQVLYVDCGYSVMGS